MFGTAVEPIRPPAGGVRDVPPAEPAAVLAAWSPRCALAATARPAAGGGKGLGLGPEPLLSATLALAAGERLWLIDEHAALRSELEECAAGYISRAAPGDRTAQEWAGRLHDQVAASKARAQGFEKPAERNGVGLTTQELEWLIARHDTCSGGSPDRSVELRDALAALLAEHRQ